MTVLLKRAYQKPESRDGYRVLVDRLWPRGLGKKEAHIDIWMKDAAPSDALRKAFHDGTLTWNGFRRRYLRELEDQREALRPLVARARGGRVTLIFAARDEKRNNAAVMKSYLRMLGAR